MAQFSFEGFKTIPSNESFTTRSKNLRAETITLFSSVHLIDFSVLIYTLYISYIR